jgi:hypothetical protein
MPISRRAKIVAGALALPTILIVVVMTVIRPRYFGDRWAVYDGFMVGSHGPEFRDFRSDWRSRELPELFIKAPDGKTYALKDLPESVAEKYIGNKTDFSDSPIHPSNEVSYSIFLGPRLTYENGKLKRANFEGAEGFEFAPTMQGPFLKVPATRAELIEVFGKPSTWKRRGPPPGPPW